MRFDYRTKSTARRRSCSARWRTSLMTSRFLENSVGDQRKEMNKRSRGEKSWIYALLAASIFISACASWDGRGLVVGQATEEQVEKLMGPSGDRRSAPDGQRLRY